MAFEKYFQENIRYLYHTYYTFDSLKNGIVSVRGCDTILRDGHPLGPNQTLTDLGYFFSGYEKIQNAHSGSHIHYWSDSNPSNFQFSKSIFRYRRRTFFCVSANC